MEGQIGFGGAEGSREQKVLEDGLEKERKVLDKQGQGDARAGWTGCPGFGSQQVWLFRRDPDHNNPPGGESPPK